MDINNYKRIFGFATFFAGLYYFRFSVLFAVEYQGLPPDYLRAIFYLALSIVMFWLFKNRAKFALNRTVFWIFTLWGCYVLFDLVNRILPNYY